MSTNAIDWDAPPALPADHYVNAAIYTSEHILAEERNKIFAKTWKFVCHESELPRPGDYRTTEHAGIPLLLTRGEDGVIRCFYNACSHRGALVATKPRGNAKRLTCFFHRWTFDTCGRCTGMTRPEGYAQHGPSKEASGLRAVRCETPLGLVFINLDDNAEDFDRHIGESLDQLREPMGTVPLEVFHLHRVTMRANWKQWQETNMELYHEWGHVVNRVTSVGAKGYHERLWGIHANGHGWLDPLAVKYDNYSGWESRDHTLLPGMTPGEFRVVDLFPNTTIIIRGSVVRIDTTIPIAPGVTILEQRGLGVKGDSAEDRRTRQKHHNQFWGPLGRNLAEDVIFVEAVERTLRHGGSRWGVFARHENLMSQDDEIMRAYYHVWGRMMGCAASNPLGEDRSAPVSTMTAATTAKD